MFYGIMFYAVPLYIIISVVIYYKTKKLSNIFFGISIITYFISITYMQDKFDFGKTGIMLTLIISAVLMMLIGYTLTKMRFPKKPIQNLQFQKQQYIPNYPQNQNIRQRNYPQNHQYYQNERK